MSDWKGIDPLVKALRVIAIISFLVLLGVVVLGPNPDSSLAFLLAGSILISLGYNAIVRLPSFGAEKVGDKKPEDSDA